MDLFNWFMQQDKPDDPAMERMIEQIRRLRPLDH
jgi:succinate dehydrogenase flavin-adding protein (antitoxin of CptAB toxin-antitoxin module)